MLSVQSCSGMNMAGSAPILPGFGSSGKSFLIDNLLQAQTQTQLQHNGLKGSHLRPTTGQQLGSSWALDLGLYQSQAHRKDLGGPPPVPHSAGKGATFNLTASKGKKDKLGLVLLVLWCVIVKNVFFTQVNKKKQHTNFRYYFVWLCIEKWHNYFKNSKTILENFIFTIWFP